MVKQKLSEKNCPISRRLSKTALKHPSANTLIQKAKKALSQNIQIGKILLSQLKELTWDSSASQFPQVSPHICPICTFNYNNSTRPPICLPCGHTLCKSCVYSLHNSLLTGQCPFDRKEYFFIEDLLPINHALIEYHESQSMKICSIHGMLIIGYCKDHSSLLCGKCIFSHKSHNYLEIDSLQAKEIADKKIIGIVNVEARLTVLLEIWEDYKKFILAAVDRMSQVIDRGQKFLYDPVAETVRQYVKNILDDFGNRESECSINISLVINCLENQLVRVRAFKANFDQISIFDKLGFDTGKTLEFDSPSLVRITEVISELEQQLNNREINLNRIE